LLPDLLDEIVLPSQVSMAAADPREPKLRAPAVIGPRCWDEIGASFATVSE